MQALWLALVLTVIDGNTLRVQIALWPNQTFTTSVRLAGIDAPELHGRCPEERVQALAAQRALHDLTQDGHVALGDPHADKYGRTLATLTNAQGQDVAAELLRRGLVRAYDGGVRSSWCHDDPPPAPPHREEWDGHAPLM